MVRNRLSKIMSGFGVASRRECEELIFLGKVRVNGRLVKDPATFIDSDKDRVEVDNKIIEKSKPALVYLAFNKPVGFICTHHGESVKRNIYKFFQHYSCRLFSAGRLDKDTSGLLIVTNDGDFANKVIHPSSNITKEYLFKTVQELEHDHLVSIMEGAVVEGTFVKPVSVKKVRRGTGKIVVKEGKKHEVRTLIAKAGLTLVELTRIRIGSLVLGTLQVGDSRPLARHEISELVKEN